MSPFYWGLPTYLSCSDAGNFDEILKMKYEPSKVRKKIHVKHETDILVRSPGFGLVATPPSHYKCIQAYKQAVSITE